MRIFTVVLLLFVSLKVTGQDIPMFSQKLTNAFIYNPSFAGNSKGSFTYSYRSNYSGVKGAPKNNFISLHSPLANYRFGIGANLFQEEVGAIKSTYASVALAYHINFDRYSALSFGVSGEYNMVRLSNDAIAQNDGDLVLARYGKGINTPDFSFGVNYQNRYIKFGVAANRLKTAWFQKDSARNLANFYSASLQGTIPIMGGNATIEPYLAYRKFSETNQGFNVGLYGNFNKKITVGVAGRSGGVFNATAAFNITPNIMIGYTREMILGSLGGYTGASNEFVLRLDFGDRGSKVQYKSDYKSALSYRKKSTSSGGARKAAGSRNPKQLHKAQKRVSAYSPNARYQNMSKLSHGKKSPSKKPTYNKVKKRPTAKKSVKRKSSTRRRR